MAKALNLNVSVFVLTLLTALMTLTLLTPELSRADSLREEIREFHGFLNDHPRIANQLQRDPWLVNNPGYLNDHEELRRFLRHHPRVRQEFLANPGRVLGYASYGYASNSRPYFQGYPPYDYRRYEDYRGYDQPPYRYQPRYDRWWERRHSAPGHHPDKIVPPASAHLPRHNGSTGRRNDRSDQSSRGWHAGRTPGTN